MCRAANRLVIVGFVLWLMLVHSTCVPKLHSQTPVGSRESMPVESNGIVPPGSNSKITPEQREFFERDVRPLLVEHCYECHSQKAKRLEANLRLDGRELLLAGGDTGPAVVAGDVDGSLLIQAIRHETFEMPPSGKLPDAAIAIFAEWVRQGAPWPDDDVQVTTTSKTPRDWQKLVREHWCWQPITDPPLPTISKPSWPRNPIDHFVLAKLDSLPLTPASEAQRATLIRRLYYDLIGLPPTPDQIHAFLTNASDDAYEQVVDGLLRSPHFGEKWTRHWLDLVRYAETCGHEFDYPLPNAYQYRDYLIRAWNADVPYDQLVREHVAGDLLPAPRRNPTEAYDESILGTGFWFLGEAVHSPTDVLQDAADRMDNQIDVFCKSFLGLTVACARCHDHKFDPIPTTDYYALAGFLRSSRRQEVMLDPEGKIHNRRKVAAELHRQAVGAWRENPYPSESEQPLAERLVDAVKGGDVASLQLPTHPFHALHRVLSDSSFFVGGLADRESKIQQVIDVLRQAEQVSTQSRSDCQTFADFASPRGTDGWYITGEAFGRPAEHGYWQPLQQVPLAHPGQHSGLWGNQLCGVLRSPTFTLEHRQIHLRMNATSAQVRLIVDGYTMDIFNALLFADNTLEDVSTQGQTRWVTQSNDLGHYLGHRAHLEIIDHGPGYAAIDEICFSNSGTPNEPPHPWNGQVLSGTHDSVSTIAGQYALEIQGAISRWRSGTASASDVDALNWLIQAGVISLPSTWEETAKQIAEIDRQIPTPMWGMGLADGDGENSHVYIRGSHRNQGDEVPRRLLTALGGDAQPILTAHSGRLELAEQIVATENPLTARVIVNRLWHHLFGRGIVPTVDDFGKMGQPPSHPELLDWLAYDFVHRQHWSLKQAIRQMVTSQTYRMSSLAAEPQSRIAEVDPNNAYLHRANIRRLSAESLRDSLLLLAGCLDRKLYGPSVPVHISPFMEGRGRPESGPLDGAGRRSLYVQVRRNFLSPLMLAFDMPIPFNSMGRRSLSNVPAQSLILMNDPFVIEQADRWAKSLRENDSLDTESQRITHAFVMATGHPPTDAQMQESLRFLTSATNPEQGWHDLCHVLLNLKQFLYVY